MVNLIEIEEYNETEYRTYKEKKFRFITVESKKKSQQKPDLIVTVDDWADMHDETEGTKGELRKLLDRLPTGSDLKGIVINDSSRYVAGKVEIFINPLNTK